MRVTFYRLKFFLVQLIVLTLGITAMHCPAALAQAQPDRVWLAGRYDGTRLVVYFDAVQFNGTIPPRRREACLSGGSGLFLSRQTSSELHCTVSKWAEYGTLRSG
jgi:hypothetical protein